MELDPRTAAAAAALNALSRAHLLDAFDLFAEGETEEETSATLDRWFDGADWEHGGHRVQQVAHDGAGGMYCLWTAPGRPPSVVLFGAEGQLRSCAPSLEAFVRGLADGDADALGVYAWERDDRAEVRAGPDLPAMRALVERHLPGPPRSEEPAGDFVAWARAVIDERDAVPA